MESKQLGKFVWFFLLCWKCHFKHVLSSADGIFTCPGFWMDKSAYNLTCEVYTASVNNITCPGASGELSFSFTPYGGVLLQYCTVSSYFDAGCDKSFNSKGCRCKEKTNNDTYVLEYMVTANVTTQMGGSWSCVPQCYDSNFVPVSKNITPTGNCTNVVIVTTSTTAVTTVASDSKTESSSPSMSPTSTVTSVSSVNTSSSNHMFTNSNSQDFNTNNQRRITIAVGASYCAFVIIVGTGTAIWLRRRKKKNYH